MLSATNATDPVQFLLATLVLDIAEFAALAFADPPRFAGRTLELAGDQPTPVEAAAISEATGVRIRYDQLADDEAATIGPEVCRDQETLAGRSPLARRNRGTPRHPSRTGTFTDRLTESGAAAIRRHLDVSPAARAGSR
ncbi:hypothetical protein Raf01_73190 [Rugosimonospora africana]|uniref:Uncharacterized protein n=2 Tax=Rugosimonospora africana TaxID=556532 RepID=A0A8J3QZP2_9ACTN|nr:hypothetical protein Raf01_73190 [Rugosimonospora africana]